MATDALRKAIDAYDAYMRAIGETADTVAATRAAQPATVKIPLPDAGKEPTR